MQTVAVYGSLRQGFGNHLLLKTSEYLGTQTVNIPYKMISLWRASFPALLPVKENNEITIEVYNVTEQTFQNLDRLEGYPSHYNRVEIETDYGNAWIYFQERELENTNTIVKSGDWRQFKEALHEVS